MIHYFWKSLKPSIKVKIEHQDRALTSFKEIVQRVINTEAKIGLKSSIMVRDVDSHCSKGHCLSQNTSAKMQTQGSTAKKSKPEKFKPKDLKPANMKTSAPPRTNKTKKTSYQDKKKEYLKKKRDRKNSTPVIKNNAIEGKKKRNNWGDGKCYNCQKRVILLGIARNLQKTSVGLGNLYTDDCWWWENRH